MRGTAALAGKIVVVTGAPSANSAWDLREVQRLIKSSSAGGAQKRMPKRRKRGLMRSPAEEMLPRRGFV